jgi:hypothetical protein
LQMYYKSITVIAHISFFYIKCIHQEIVIMRQRIHRESGDSVLKAARAIPVFIKVFLVIISPILYEHYG